MVTISDLPRDLLGEILSRFPLTSLRFDIQGILNDEHLVDPSVKRIIKPNDNEVEFCRVFHCHGLFLCVAEDHPRVLVCNPYIGQIKWIQASREQKTYRWLQYALGYDNNNHNHKIISWEVDGIKSIDVYDFSSESWKVLDVYPGKDDFLFNYGVSVKGNTYFECEVITAEEEKNDMYLLCFDFTTEQFGLPLRLPFPWLDTYPLYWVRDEKLVVYKRGYEYSEIIEIWITTKIEPNAISWKNFLKVDLRHINGLPNDFTLEFCPRSFFIYEEKKVVVAFYETRPKRTEPCRHLHAYIFGEDGYYKSVNMGVEAQDHFKSGEVVCSSYVPSLVQLKLN